MKSKRITIATIKSFIRKNRENLLIDIHSRFNGMTDGVERVEGGFEKAAETTNNVDYTLGVAGAWFVGSSRDYFKAFETDDHTGFVISNSCGRFTLAIKK